MICDSLSTWQRVCQRDRGVLHIPKVDYSEVQYFSVFGGTIRVYMLLQASVPGCFHVAREQAGAIQLEKGFKEVLAAVLEHAFHLFVAGELPKTLRIQICLVKLHRRSLLTQHKLLKGHEAHVPGITFLVGYKA